MSRVGGIQYLLYSMIILMYIKEQYLCLLTMITLPILQRRLHAIQQQRIGSFFGQVSGQPELPGEHHMYQFKQNALFIAEKRERRAGGAPGKIRDLLRGRPLIALFKEHLDGCAEDLLAGMQSAGLYPFLHLDHVLNCNSVYKPNYNRTLLFFQL